ncbi:hypothetical protein ACN47E_006363 [Coniothyrium glycines]
MRPLRLLMFLSTSVVVVTLFVYLVIGLPQHEPTPNAPGRLKALFSFTSPGSLFPPSAIISLTDDNSTFFLARPAAFGPDLPKDGLSGPLWIGSGFGNELTSTAGELGCSDVPGWDDSDQGLATADMFVTTSYPSHAYAGTQYLQQSAEIAGKVVLLRRGGCGFLAKVQWAQRRGGTAVIVGDDVRGGALVRMFAKGDTSNITIPSLFTSHTTAHLLSSLIPSGDRVRHNGFDYENVETKVDSARASSAGNAQSHDVRPVTSALIEEDNINEHASPTHSGASAARNLRIVSSARRLVSRLNRKLFVNPADPAASIMEHSEGNIFGTGEDTSQADRRLWWTAQQESGVGTELKVRTRRKGRSMTCTTNAHWKRMDTSPHTQIIHKGLWVTLTPTNVSTSPFFDTLLVLVVSPLVTLTVVYALLLVRSRIRRRRWRAPKSVVERLPVRTYQTISGSPSTATSEASSPTTPLLQHSQSVLSNSIVRPEVDCTITEPSTATPRSTRDREEEKRESGLASWRRRYGGRQRECVVCLDEYVDGVSQVMSLPCGHEFHAECITPWLVTRRRTCPICKGDVVRSLSQSYHDRLQSPSPTRLPGGLIDDPDIQRQTAETINGSPSASQYVAVSMSAPADFSPLAGADNAWPSAGISRQLSETEPSDLSSSSRDTRATIIWRGFDTGRFFTPLRQRTPSPQSVERE